MAETQSWWPSWQAVPPGGHRLPPLPYPYNALEPVISERQLRTHHDRHHLAYVEGLNKAELKLVEARQKGDFSLVKHWERELAFHGSGHILHSIYWTVMAPWSGSGPGSLLREKINSYFGSMTAFQEQFMKAAIDVEGSGWAILIWQPAWGRLEILTAEKHQDLTQWGGIPILVLDVWEHAYYLDYQNRRADYVKAWWQHVNWPEVERRLQMAIPAGVPLTCCPGAL
ncbi:Manganese/iron superoxide dismutase [Moorella glycerini]|uniref:Superoxide dismutase n=1 Tax=Neomoorella stamsii TaxID=1266720 RepID=A0A9X7J6Q4_9FIRM|nr:MULTISPECIES: superoxide dismutase [Moorella]PRR77542.1 Superoxide dismutase [Moorella stamsii]CEP69411.1 Manganese/iron superoxide dismutase [Moorella glycerini]